MTLPDIKVTSEMLWVSAIITALLAMGFLIFLNRRAERIHFGELHLSIALASGVFWFSYGLLLFAMTWESFYATFLPAPSNRSLARFMLELAPYPFIGLILWWLASRLPGNPVLTFCLLGGLEALPEHLWGIYHHGMLDKVPFLQEASKISVISFAIPEYVLYWASVLSIAMLIQRSWQWFKLNFVSKIGKKAG